MPLWAIFLAVGLLVAVLVDRSIGLVLVFVAIVLLIAGAVRSRSA